METPCGFVKALWERRAGFEHRDFKVKASCGLRRNVCKLQEVKNSLTRKI